ncbi:MAG: elongation factor P [Bdellovibrionaceae bacterium]|nr:elongation factor P [Pseudobdellovibrionaceae bacterium]
MNVSTGDFKKGLKLLINNEPHVILDFEHYKPGKGNQFTRTKLKNLITGKNIDRTIKSGEKYIVPDIEYADTTYLYKDASSFVFMDQTSYEQISIDTKLIAENIDFLVENLPVNICFFQNKAINIELPASVDLKVTYTEPGLKGDTVSGATKPATLETNLTLQVPLHIANGDILKINTKNREYIEKVSTKKNE